MNNQYQSKPFSVYEIEFIELVNSAISFVGDDATKLIIVSIPDYAYTPYGQNGNALAVSADINLQNIYQIMLKKMVLLMSILSLPLVGLLFELSRIGRITSVKTGVC